jgi:hypothetical protein
MAKKTAPSTVPNEENGKFQEASPITGFDLAERLPVWSPKYTKTAVWGLLLGPMRLPSNQPNQEFWPVFVLELLANAMVVESEEGEQTTRVAEKGERVLVTCTAALRKEMVLTAAMAKGHVHELYLKPGPKVPVKKGPNAGAEVQTFDKLVIGPARPRSAEQVLPSSSIEPRRRLPAAPAAPFEEESETTADDLPF